MRVISIALAMSLTVLAAVAAPDEWCRSTNVIDSPGNLAIDVRWAPERGLHFRLSTTNADKTVHLELASKAGRIRLVPEDAFPPAAISGSRCWPAALPASASPALRLILKFRQENWSLYSGDRCVAVIPAPFPLPAVVSQPSAECPSGSLGRVHFQKTADFVFEDSFMRPEESQNPLGEWNVESGSWYLHTALETAIESNLIKPDAKRSLKPDFSPNFYSLAGKGTNAVITAGYDFYDDYAFEAGVRIGSGEQGLLFYCQDSGACHGFTAKADENSDRILLTLWNRASSNSPQRNILGAVTTRGVPGQWVKFKVKVFQNRIQCFMDRAKAIDVTAELPAGGRFGLYADGDEEVRFDDVSVGSDHDPDFAGAGDLLRSVLVENGSLLPRRRGFGLMPPDLAAATLSPAVSRRPQWLVVGSPSHAPHVFSADFSPKTPRYCVGLLAGYTGADRPYYRFTCRRSETNETFLLERVSTNGATAIEESRLPAAKGGKTPGRLNLMFDASAGAEWRLYRDGQLALVHVPAPEANGASGLYVGGGTRTAISIPEYRFKRDDLFKNRYEKNNRFTDDPFMRHWASPEGQWLGETNALTWYTGDFFSRFSLRMPCVEPSEIHLGVEEDATNGERIVSVRDRKILLLQGPNADARATPLAQAPTNALSAGPDGTGIWYTVQCEGAWLWLTSGDKLLFKHRMEKPLKGRRIRVAGFTTDQLKTTFVERFNVKDFLFTESLFDWVVNGGRWEVINRFQCDPRWSHMNGEGTNSLAALWAKYEIRGDFCIEMHAGQRMGWYERCGDLNMTVMNRDATPSQGYTVTCTGWDPDHSQLYTTLYRNGEVMARSDKYLVPRKREGNKRLGYEPLIAGGRDVHGAWYYMKFRRVGNKLEYDFDNERVFSVVDDHPLQGGSAGIWTFLNSMMVARVKVAAEEIRPRAPSFAPVPPHAFDRPPAAAPHPCSSGLLNNGRPLDLCLPAYWTADDPVGRLRLDWGNEPGVGPSFTARAGMGGGSMFTACSLYPVSFPELAGWRFDVKRTAGAQFNFYFSTGRIAEDGEYKAERRFFHRLSGSDSDKGVLIKCGETPVPATAATGGNGAANSPWTTVTVWLPRDGVSNPADPNRRVRIEGFGLLDPSVELQGLTGNAPGEQYAVRDFSEITYSQPRLTLSTNLPAPVSFALLDMKTGRRKASFGSVEGLQSGIDSLSTAGLFRVSVQAVRTNALSTASLAWIRLPARPAVTCAWSVIQPDSVVLRADAPYPDPRFLNADVLIGDVRPVLIAEGFDKRLAVAPRRETVGADRLPVTLTGEGIAETFSLAWKDNPARGAPVLLAVSGITPFLENAEQDDPQAALPAANSTRARLAFFDPEQGRYLEAKNTLHEKRLRTQIPVTLSLARYPVFQFRYRTDDPMTRVSLSLGNSRTARISEAAPAVMPVRYATDLRMDGRWHTWLGQVSDALSSLPFEPGLFRIARPELGSFHSIDQTGAFSRWDLDDIVFGPAVSSREQLAFIPRYFDFSGIESVRMAVRQGPEAFAELAPAQASRLAWQTISNGVEAVPCIDGLTDGVCRLFMQARSRNGKDSQVTDIPFLLDREPLKNSHVIGTSDSATSNGAELRAAFVSGGGAPLDPENLKITWNGGEVPGTGRAISLQHLSEQDTLTVIWPYFFRDQLDATTNGQTVRIGMTGVRDGAGNPSPDVVVPLTIDYARDHIPPSLLPTVYPTNVLVCTAWEVGSENNTLFTPRGNDTLELVRGTNEPPFLRVKTGADGGVLARFDKGDWKLGSFPCLAFRIRRPIASATNDHATLMLSAESSTGESLQVPLTAHKPSPRLGRLPEPLDWRSNIWESVFLNVNELMTSRVPPEARSIVSLKNLSIRLSGADSAAWFDLQNFFVFGPGKPEDKVKIHAYDASGMDRVEWQYETPGGQVVEPAEFLRSPASTNMPPRRWVVLRARDKAGNLAMPFRVPAWSATTPTGDK